MAANFWKGSQCASWMLDEAVLERAKERDSSFLSRDHQAVLTYLFADVVRELGEELNLRQQVVATAVIYFKRFYHKHTWTSIQPFLMAQTCIYLAAKVEECGPIPVRRVQGVGGRVADKFAPLILQPGGKPFTSEQIIECEFYLVQAMDCCLIVFHPYRSLVEYANESKTADQLLPMAWNVVNDSYKSDLCFLFPPYLIALGSLQLATTVIKGDAADAYRAWFATLVNISTSEVMEVVQAMLDLYASLDVYDQTVHAAAALDAVAQECSRLNEVDGGAVTPAAEDAPPWASTG